MGIVKFAWLSWFSIVRDVWRQQFSVLSKKTNNISVVSSHFHLYLRISALRLPTVYLSLVAVMFIGHQNFPVLCYVVSRAALQVNCDKMWSTTRHSHIWPLTHNSWTHLEAKYEMPIIKLNTVHLKSAVSGVHVTKSAILHLTVNCLLRKYIYVILPNSIQKYSEQMSANVLILWMHSCLMAITMTS